MEFAYLDESGEEGALGSKNLVLTLVCTSQNKKLSKIIRNTKIKLLNKKRNSKWLASKGGEIKFSCFPDKELLKKTLKEISNLDIRVYYLGIIKENKKLKKEVRQFIMTYLFEHIFENGNKIIPQKIIADMRFFNNKKKNYFLLEKYESQNQKNIDENKPDKIEISFSHITDEKELDELKKDSSNIIVAIEHQNSRHSDELQATDLICGSIFANIEYKNSEYVNILSSSKLKIKGRLIKKKI